MSKTQCGIFGRLFNIMLPILTGCAVAFYITSAMSCETVIRASLNGTPVGYVRSGSTFTNAELALEDYITEAADLVYDPDCRITYELVHMKNEPVYLTEEECYDILWNTVKDEFVEASMLYVDDRQAAAYESGEELDALIREIETELLASGGKTFSNVRISNSLRIEEQLCLRSMLRSIEEINELLNPLADEAAAAAAAMLADEAEDDDAPVMLRVSAFASASPGQEADLYDPDIDYGVNRAACIGEIAEETDLTLDYNFVNTIRQTETIYYQTQYVDDYKHFIGTNKETVAGSNGQKRVTYELTYDADGKLVAKTPIEEEIITPAVDRVVMVGSKKIPPSVPTGTFLWPCETPKGISSPYGWRTAYGKTEFHLGIDLPDDKGSPIWASDGGEIIWAGYTPSYGYSVRIQHADDYITVYAHLSEILVSVGDNVYQGQQIGKMGSTGMSYGSHLHFEVRIGSHTYDPMKYLPPIVIPEEE